MTRPLPTLAALALAPALAAAFAPATAQTTDTGKPRVVVTDASIVAGQKVTWTAGTVYELRGFVYVEDGAELTIEPGTVVKAQTGTGSSASALVIARGAKLFASGTASNPIVFTSVRDSVAVPDISRINGGQDGVDYTEDRSLWGGIVLLGRASNNVGANVLVEGLPNDPRAYYGPGVGNTAVEDDNSGIVRYVSIKYSGSVIESNKELQSLTLASVGSGTTIEYVESFNSGDDGFEFFGGTVNTKHLIAFGADDDSFDYDEGFRGKHQFWFALQAPNNGDKLGEFDSGNTTPGLTATPLADPQIYNATLIGMGSTAGITSPKVTDGLIFKEYGGGRVANSIVMDVRGYVSTLNADTKARFTAGGVVLTNNLFHAIGKSGSNDADFAAYLAASAQGNRTADPQLTGVARTHTAATKLDPRPAVGGPAYTGFAVVPVDGFYTPVAYVGAFGATNWAANWTAMSTNGILSNAGSVNVERDAVVGGAPVRVWPNPARGAATVAFSLDRAQHVRVTVYDLTGRAVATLLDGLEPAGERFAAIDGGALPSGTYLVRVASESGTATRTLVLTR